MEGRSRRVGVHTCIRKSGVCVQVQYYLEEAKGHIDYQGWGGRQDRDKTDDVHLVTVRFAWDGDGDADVEIKPLSSFLCGRSSPALSPRAPLDLDAFVFRGVGQGHAGGWCWA